MSDLATWTAIGDLQSAGAGLLDAIKTQALSIDHLQADVRELRQHVNDLRIDLDATKAALDEERQQRRQITARIRRDVILE